MSDKPVLTAIETPAKEPPDPFDLELLRLSQNFIESAGGQEADYRDSDTQAKPAGFRPRPPGSGVSGRSPHGQPQGRPRVLRGGPELAAELAGETISKSVYTAINRQRTLFLWPVTLPPPDGRDLAWWRTYPLGLTRSPRPVRGTGSGMAGPVIPGDDPDRIPDPDHRPAGSPRD